MKFFNTIVIQERGNRALSLSQQGNQSPEKIITVNIYGKNEKQIGRVS